MWWYSKRMRRHPINWGWSVFLGLRSEGARPDVCKIFRKILITTGNIWVVYQRQRWDDFITYTLKWTFLLTLYEHLTPLSTQIALIKVLIVHKVLIMAFIQHRFKVYPLKLIGCQCDCRGCGGMEAVTATDVCVTVFNFADDDTEVASTACRAWISNYISKCFVGSNYLGMLNATILLRKNIFSWPLRVPNSYYRHGLLFF